MTNEQFEIWMRAFEPTTWSSIRKQWEQTHPDWDDDLLDAKADDLYNDYLESRGK